jgi:voltage-gated potassium channel
VDAGTTNNLRSRLLVAALGMATIYTAGTAGYYMIGHGRWRLADCAYMTVISLTTVGYGEVLQDMHKVPYARLFTGFLLMGGAGIAVYFVSVLTTYLDEGEFLQSRRRKRMRKIIESMSGHIIVCGAGGTGRHVVDELTATRWPFLLIDTDAEKLERLQEMHANKLAVVQGDATDDDVLVDAGIMRAHGIVASLPDDKGNLFVVVTARGLNPKLRIVAKAMESHTVRKLQAAGADAVVSVNNIGGMRMASEMIRPAVVTFLDKMLRDKDKALRFEEMLIPPGSPLVQKKLAQSDIRRERNLLIVAARTAAGEYVYSPGPDFLLEANMVLIVIGETQSVQRLRESPLFAAAADEGEGI